MLLTAQRVTSPDGRRSGVNAFLYRHGPKPDIDWSHLDADKLEELIQSAPGVLSAELLDVVPGRNAVASFVDVVAPDDTAPSIVLGALRRGLELLKYGAAGSSVIRGPLALRISAGSLPAERRRDEFRLLTERLSQLLVSPPRSPWRVLPPLRIVARRTSDGWRLQLDQASAARIRNKLGAGWQLVSLTATDEVLAQLRTVAADLLPHVLPSAAGLSPEMALSFGGIEVVDEDGTTLRSWPNVAHSSLGGGYCLRCHQHNTLVVAGDGSLRCTACGTSQADDGRWVGTLGG